MNKTCQCGDKKKDVVVIKLETCNKKTCPALGKDDKKTASDENVAKQPNEKIPSNNNPRDVQPRAHGPGCVMEVSVLEKHNDGCAFKKGQNPNLSPEDRCGSYEVVGRMSFKTCEADAKKDERQKSQTELARRSSMKKSMSKDLPTLSQKSNLKINEDAEIMNENIDALNDSVKPSSSRQKSTEDDMDVATTSNAAPDDLDASPLEQTVLHLALNPPTSDHFMKNLAKKHYSGDQCKLHRPPQLDNYGYPPHVKRSLKRLAESDKAFPDLADKTFQVPSYASTVARLEIGPNPANFIESKQQAPNIDDSDETLNEEPQLILSSEVLKKRTLFQRLFVCFAKKRTHPQISTSNHTQKRTSLDLYKYQK